jgi:hypothetical protein
MSSSRRKWTRKKQLSPSHRLSLFPSVVFGLAIVRLPRFVGKKLQIIRPKPIHISESVHHFQPVKLESVLHFRSNLSNITVAGHTSK